MTIGFDGSRAFLKERTGTENYSYQLLTHLSKIDHKNTYLIYLRPGTPEDVLRAWPGNFKFKTLDYKLLWTQIGLAIATFKDNLDVLFVPSHTLPLIRRPGLKTVMTVHDLGAEYLPQMHQLKQWLYLNFITHFQFKSATKIIAVSKATKEDLIKKADIEPEKIEVVYEGVDRELFKQVKGDVLANSLSHYDLKAKSFFLFVGTIQPRKNVKRLIEAFKMYFHKNNPPLSSLGSKLVIVGSKGWLSDEIYQLPSKLEIEDRVKFLPPEGGRVGHIPDKNLPHLYSGAVALVFPSLYEGFGLPILEAMACGCPVITSNISSMPEVAGDAATLINPYNIKGLAGAMRKIREDVILRDSLIQKGFRQVNKFTWKKCAQETLELLKTVMNNS